jgi:hypothetical protein
VDPMIGIVNPANGTILSSSVLNHFYDGLAFRASDGILFGTAGAGELGNVNDIYTIVPGTYAETFVGASTRHLSDLDFQTPEPSTFTLATLALAGVIAARRRHTAKIR